ncbi:MULTISPECIES: hypothetical protein [Mesorhizobium]|uniref:Uncharacterized protein n=1 Tax=Rhizobium loti TaxID=381 RepID=A0A6M7U094_RHILI|nr:MULTISPECIES: hypothetical protein [Mesorhizobium]KRB31194.1 hypothetical protein ASE05_28435 [Mesorhizobium sp. Root172]OBQ60948.1 hypothetical protein A8145_23900 [Mesorhizobium loti]QKC70026.1 hypothetical protein EB815_13355 [Mesorhizobium loti]QKC92093.1 hypothetical protein EB230_29585 [Mesorhizobium sp. NZP2234]
MPSAGRSSTVNSSRAPVEVGEGGFARNLIDTLRDGEVNALGARLAAETGLPLRELLKLTR